MSIVSDVRLRRNFYSDINTQRLIKRCGAEAIVALQKLWIHAAEHFPAEGTLIGYTDDEVEMVLESDDKTVIPALQELGLIERDVGGYVKIANWEVDQQWVVGAPERSAKARSAAKKRWQDNQNPRQDSNSDEQIDF